MYSSQIVPDTLLVNTVLLMNSFWGSEANVYIVSKPDKYGIKILGLIIRDLLNDLCYYICWERIKTKHRSLLLYYVWELSKSVRGTGRNLMMDSCSLMWYWKNTSWQVSGHLEKQGRNIKIFLVWHSLCSTFGNSFYIYLTYPLLSSLAVLGHYDSTPFFCLMSPHLYYSIN
jgi:hypothetical protein